MKRRVSWIAARKMWRNGKDTSFIAEYFGRDEAHIYNGLLAHSAGKNRYVANHSAPLKHFNIVTHKGEQYHVLD